MNVILWILAGAAVGWIACAALHINVARGVVISAIIGVAGAFVGGYVLAPIFGATVGEIGAFSPFALLVAVATAIGFVSLSDMMYERFGF
jgi:uncharacterized membrane protein YeaQ/YmgE (transglycosylase-associated protein family)